MSLTDLPIDEAPKPPAFGCVVYVRKVAGGVTARVANLDDMNVQAATERDALGKLVPMFREKVSELMQQGIDVPWIEPPLPIQDDEQRRFLPVHL